VRAVNRRATPDARVRAVSDPCRGEYDVTPIISRSSGVSATGSTSQPLQRARLHDRAASHGSCGRSDREPADERLGILDSHARGEPPVRSRNCLRSHVLAVGRQRLVTGSVIAIARRACRSLRDPAARQLRVRRLHGVRSVAAYAFQRTVGLGMIRRRCSACSPPRCSRLGRVVLWGPLRARAGQASWPLPRVDRARALLRRCCCWRTARSRRPTRSTSSRST